MFTLANLLIISTMRRRTASRAVPARSISVPLPGNISRWQSGGIAPSNIIRIGVCDCMLMMNILETSALAFAGRESEWRGWAGRRATEKPR